MKLILNSDVQSLGRKGDVVDVAKGYARNYLLPKKLAIVATANNLEFAQKLHNENERRKTITMFDSTIDHNTPYTKNLVVFYTFIFYFRRCIEKH